MKTVLTGLDRIGEGSFKRIGNLRLGLLANQASLNAGLVHGKKVINNCFPDSLKALFGPQHGYGGEDQDNMVETGHSMDRELSIPIFSLYSETRQPTHAMLDTIDALIIDLQDIGTRVYTFATTMLNCMIAAAKNNKKIIVLDRPNPLGGMIMEGNLLDPDLYSFVGPYAIPMRHGMTMGELALMFNDVFRLGCDLEIIPMQGWKRNMLWKDTGLRWIIPSTNMPTPDTAAVYPGQVIWEGTNVSEGRGTCRPFEIFGAPYIDTARIKCELEPDSLKGCMLQEYVFRPTFHKWQGKICKGFMIHILDPETYRPYLTSTAVLGALIKIHHTDFKWKEPPYEYEYKKLPIDLITGSSEIRTKLESGTQIFDVCRSWQSDIDFFSDFRKPYLLYEE